MRLLGRRVSDAGENLAFDHEVSAQPRWQTHIPGVIAHGITLAPETSSLYTGDGWLSTYASMRIRRFDLQTGAETASFRAFNGLRCGLVLDGTQDLFAVMDTRLLQLDGMTLAERRRWDERIPRYGASVAVGAGTAVLANAFDPKIGLVNLETGSVRRRASPALTLVLPRGIAPLLVGGSETGGTWQVELPGGEVSALLDTPPALDAALTPNGDHLYLLVGVRGKLTATSGSLGGKSSRVSVYDVDGRVERARYRLPIDASSVLAGRRRALFAASSVTATFDLARGRLGRWRVPGGHEVIAMHADSALVITRAAGRAKDTATLTCWELSTP